jgi:hypothetical protein
MTQRSTLVQVLRGDVKAEQKELSLEVKTCLSYMLLNPGTHGM